MVDDEKGWDVIHWQLYCQCCDTFQNNSWRQDPARCVHLPFHRNQAPPSLHSSPHGNPDARPTGELQHLTKYSLCMTEDPGLGWCLPKKKPHQTGRRWSRQVSGLTTVLPGHRDSRALLYCLLWLAHSKKGPTNQFFKRWRILRCCPRQHTNSLRSAYIHLHVKLPSGALTPPGHVLYVQQAPSQNWQCISRSVLAKWKEKAIFTAPGLTCTGQCLPGEVSQLDEILFLTNLSASPHPRKPFSWR